MRLAGRKPDLRQRALDYLARREYSRQALRRKLSLHAGESDNLDALLDDLEQRRWLSDARFVEQRIAARREKFGARRIAHELRENGVAETLIAEALPQLQQDEFGAALGAWRKKFGQPAQDARERARQMRFLQGRGFSGEVIRRIVENSGDGQEY